MASIYANAKRVLVWLGPDDANMRHYALRFMHTAINHLDVVTAPSDPNPAHPAIVLLYSTHELEDFLKSALPPPGRPEWAALQWLYSQA